MKKMKRVVLIVLDGAGAGWQHDAAKYGDEGANTLASVAASGRLHLPNLRALGLYNIEGVTAGERCSTRSALTGAGPGRV